MDKIVKSIKKKGHNSQSHLLFVQNYLSASTTLPKITMTSDDNDVEIEMDSNGQFNVGNTQYDISDSLNKANVSTVPLITQEQSQQKTQTNDLKTNNRDSTINFKAEISRKQSTGTLNRLMLVAQALESEVDSRNHNAINGSRIVSIIRIINMVLLALVNVLIITGVGQYQSRNDIRLSLLLSMDKWYFRHGINLPPTFAEMRLSGQYLAQTLSAIIFFATSVLQIVHCCRIQHSKLLCICYSFGCVPFSLLVFGLEMHYSACPWLDDFYRAEVLRRDFHAVEKYFDTQCGINGWALAGIFSLLSCGLFVSEGLITAFFRSGYSHNDQEKAEIIL